MTVVPRRLAARAIAEGEEAYIDMQAGRVESEGREFAFPAYPETLRRIFEAGGLIPYIAAKLARERSHA